MTFKNYIILAFLLIFNLHILLSQTFPQKFYDANVNLNQKFNSLNETLLNIDKSMSKENFKNSPSKVFEKMFDIPKFTFDKTKSNDIQGTDTLIVGFGVKDTVEITAFWEHNGPIIIGDNGVLIIKKADATILGDIYVLSNGRLEITGSTIYMPQQYFYQRSILVLHNSVFEATNTKFDYSNLSHNIVLAHNATINFKNIENKGFTTNGISGKPTYKIDGINEAGEFVITDTTNLEIKNANTILLWHHLKKGSSLDFEFPKGDTLALYNCNKNVKGFKGIDYNVHLENSTNVMWGLMPEDQSDVKVTNSKLRAIGLWFTGNEKESVSGLVNNTLYADFQPNLKDRKLRLINSEVRTWSIYTFQNSIIDLTGSIVGEIGSQGKSQITSSQVFCDGTGGYVWPTDTAFSIFGYSTATTSYRTQGNSFGFLAYSALTNGVATAVGNSNLIVIQTPLAEDPEALEGGAVWNINIEKPSLAFVNSDVKLFGSVWIDRGPYNKYIEFGSFKLDYKKNSDNKWISIAKNIKSEIRHDLVYNWNTKGLSPDQYVLRITLFNSLGDSIEALTQIIH